VIGVADDPNSARRIAIAALARIAGVVIVDHHAVHGDSIAYTMAEPMPRWARRFVFTKTTKTTKRKATTKKAVKKP
jgi:hypothetical protein